MMEHLKTWSYVIASWIAVFFSWFAEAMKWVGKWSPTIAGVTSIVALCFTIWQWRKAAKKERRKNVKHH